MSEPRPYTVEEMRMKVLDHIRVMVDYWADPEREVHMGQHQSLHHRFGGLAHSLLAMLSGCSMDIPGLNLVPSPHESDEEYRRERGENWWVSEDINNGNMHSELYNDPNGKAWQEKHGSDGDLIRYAMDEAALYFGGDDGIFNGAGFSKAFTRMAGLADHQPIDGMLVKAMLSGRRDVKALPGGYFKLNRGK
jgi:hypothetical protein